VTRQERQLLQLRVCELTVTRGPRTPEAVVRYRVAAAGRQLRKHGVTRAILPTDFPYGPQLAKCGVCPVSTLLLRQELAAEQVRWLLSERGIPPTGARVAVSGARLTGQMARTVTELALRHRYVLLDIPYGGEELCRQLRREYGVSLLLGSSREQLAGADVLVLFDPRTDLNAAAALRLYDESSPLPPLLLPPAVEAALPAGADRGQLLAALREAGAIKAGVLSVGKQDQKEGRERGAFHSSSMAKSF
jgi:hypothetical protein